MKILFWQWNAFMQKGIEKALKKLAIEYEILYYQPKDWEKEDAFGECIQRALKGKGFDAVISVNYAPAVSMACQAEGVLYIAWVYDSPIHIRDISSFHNKCNRIYFFDRGQMEAYRKQGYENVFHMPLAVDETVWQDKKSIENEVAFVGQLYKSDYNYLMSPLSQYYRGMMDGILGAQGQVYGAYLLDELISDELMQKLNEFYAKASEGTFQVQKAELEYACACEATGRERFMALSLLAGRHSVSLYSNDECKEIPGIKNRGYVDYYTGMPAVFRGARVNLNISLKTIRTGIPLRVLDVLSCGGFLISNYQEEILEYFEPGVDLVLYEDIKDLVMKVEYYLFHEEERRKIAENGKCKVREYFRFEDRIKKMLLDEKH